MVDFLFKKNHLKHKSYIPHLYEHRFTFLFLCRSHVESLQLQAHVFVDSDLKALDLFL